MRPRDVFSSGDIGLPQVIAAARSLQASLAGEVSGYLVLGVADQVRDAPRQVSPASVTLSAEGKVRVMAGAAVAIEECESDLRRLLRGLLASTRSAMPALTRASLRPSVGHIEAFVRELETALIPVNRAAGRRALARLHRETRRAWDSGGLDPASCEAQAVLPAREDATGEKEGRQPDRPVSMPPVIVDATPAMMKVEATAILPQADLHSGPRDYEPTPLGAGFTQRIPVTGGAGWRPQQVGGGINPVQPVRSIGIEARLEPTPFARTPVMSGVDGISPTPRLGSISDRAHESVTEWMSLATEEVPVEGGTEGLRAPSTHPTSQPVALLAVERDPKHRTDPPARRSVAAPPVFAPRESSVEELLRKFGAAQSDDELCRNLWDLAEVNLSGSPPAVQESHPAARPTTHVSGLHQTRPGPQGRSHR